MSIQLEQVSFHYPDGKAVFEKISLSVSAQDRICFHAPSGGGKTTLFRLILGLEQPASGVVLRSEGIRFAAVFQEDRLLPWKTALENAALFSNRAAAEAMLVRLGLAEALEQLPSALSGGMKRRVALARALCAPFDVLVLDEAFTGLDEAAKQLCLEAVQECCQGKTLLMASHDAKEAAFLACRDVFL